nr:monodehydroascorbate reductase [Tanacetum cinerariifolium]
MADVNVNAPAGQTPTMAPPMRTDDQILPHIRWVPIGKRNCYIDVENSQSNPIYKIAIDILKHINFFRAFTASSTIPSIYIQQLWDTIRYDKSAGCYRCQLDEQWFDLTKDTLRDALQITPVNNNEAFTSTPSSDALINFVNEFGYLKLVRNLSNVVTNDMFQPWRVLTTIINLCLTGKTSGFERPRAPVQQILWGVVTRTHIDYAKRICEEFTQSIHTFIEDKRNMAQRTHEKKKATLIVIPSIRFTKLIIYHLQRQHKFHPRPDSPLHLPNEEPVLGYLKFNAKGTKREVFVMPIPGSLITADIQEASYYQEYLAKVAKHRRYLAGTSKAISLRTSFISQPEPTSAPAKPQGKKRKLTTEISDKPFKATKSRHGFVSKKRKPISTLKSLDESVAKDVPAKEPQVDAEEADMQRALEESLKSMYDVPRGPLPPVVIREPEFGKYQPLPEVPRKGKEKVIEEQVDCDLLNLQTSKKKSHTNQYIFQRRTSTPTGSSEHNESSSLYAELGLSDSEEESKEVVPGADAGGQSEGQVGPDPGAQAEGQAGSDPDLGIAKTSQPTSPVVHTGSDREHMDFDVADVSPQPPYEQMDEGFTAMAYPKLKATTTKTTTTTLPPPPYQQQSTAEALMMKRIDELEHIMANLIQKNKGLEQRLDSHGARLYILEQLDIPHQVSKAVNEVVTDAVDWAIMWETDSYKSHEDHMQLYEALEKSMNRDHSEELAKYLAEARKKKKKSRESPKMPPRSPPHQPPLLPPPAGPSGASGSSGSSQVPPPPPLSTNQKGQSKGSAAPSSSKTAASAEYQASTMTDIRLWPSISLTPVDLQMDEDMAPDEQPQSSDDGDIESAHIPKVNLRQDWWKPLEEERPATLEPAWSIPSSDVPVPMNNWASALFCKRRGITELKPQDLKDPAFEIVKVFHPYVIHLQYQMEECHKLLTDSVDASILGHNVSKPLPLGGPPGHVTIQSDFFFNKDLEYLRYGSKGSRPALSISKMKAAYYPDVGLEQMVPDQI